MEWLRMRVWQLGIAVILALVGAWVMYTAGVGDVNQALLWLGLVLVFVAMAIPLISRLYQSVQGEDEDEKQA